MADNSQVIQEFLTSLGFKVDENEFKKFVGGLAVAEKGAMNTGKAVLSIAVAAEAMVVSFASSMEKLYYASQRTGASVENLQSLEFGSRKIGLAAGQAREALEGMAAATRMNPGLRSLIDGLLGKDTASLDQAQVMIELVQKLSTMPHYQGAQFASLFGMDEKTFLMLKQGLPELIKAEQERRDMNRQANIDAQNAAAAAKEYANSITDITTRLGVLRDKVALSLLPTFRELNKQIVDALNAATSMTKDDVTPEKVRGFFGDRWQATKDWFSDAKAKVKAEADAGFPNAMGRETYEKRMVWDTYIEGGRLGGGKIYYPPSTNPPPAAMRAIPRNNPGNIRKGANDFQSYATPQAGLSAMAGNLLSYYDKYGLHNIRDVVSKWAPYSENNTGAYIDDVSKRLGVKSDADLNLRDPAVLSKLMGAMIQHEQGFQPFGATDLLSSAKDRINGGAGPAVVLNQKTDIHVAGGDSPAATGRAVALEQGNVNSTLVRNFQGAVQ